MHGRFWIQGFQTNGRNLFVVGPVKDSDLTPGRSRDVAAPEEVVRRLQLRRLLEAGHPAILGIERAENVTNRHS